MNDFDWEEESDNQEIYENNNTQDDFENDNDEIPIRAFELPRSESLKDLPKDKIAEFALNHTTPELLLECLKDDTNVRQDSNAQQSLEEIRKEISTEDSDDFIPPPVDTMEEDFFKSPRPQKRRSLSRSRSRSRSKSRPKSSLNISPVREEYTGKVKGLEGDEKVKVQYERAKKRYKNAIGKPTEQKQYKSYLKYRKAYEKIKKKKSKSPRRRKSSPRRKTPTKKSPRRKSSPRRKTPTRKSPKNLQMISKYVKPSKPIGKLTGLAKKRAQYQNAKRRYLNSRGTETEEKQYQSYLKYKEIYEKAKKKNNSFGFNFGDNSNNMSFSSKIYGIQQAPAQYVSDHQMVWPVNTPNIYHEPNLNNVGRKYRGPTWGSANLPKYKENPQKFVREQTKIAFGARKSKTSKKKKKRSKRKKSPRRSRGKSVRRKKPMRSRRRKSRKKPMRSRRKKRPMDKEEETNKYSEYNKRRMRSKRKRRYDRAFEDPLSSSYWGFPMYK